MSPFRSSWALLVLAFLSNGIRAGDYDHGPVWNYWKREQVYSFGEQVYANGSRGYPAATLRFRDLRRTDVKRFGVTVRYSAYVVPDTGSYVLVWHYHEVGEDNGAGVYRVIFADGERLTRASVPGPGRGLRFLQELPTLKSLDLSGLELTDSDRKYLRGLPKLEALRLVRSTGTDELPRSVNKELKRLELPHCDITDAGLARLADLKKLEVLDLSGTGVTAAGLKHLTALERLRELTLREVDISSEEVQAVAKKLPRDVRLIWTPGRSRAERDALAVLRETNYFPDYSPGFAPAERTKPVTELGFGPNWIQGRKTDPDLGPKVMDALLALKHLERLHIGGSELTDKHLKRLKELPKLKILGITRTSPITDAGLAHLKAWPALTRLEFSNMEGGDVIVPKVTNAGLAHLAGIANLEELVIQGGQFTDEAIPHLARLKSLKTLVLDRTNCTEQGYEKLRKVLPETKFYIYRREKGSGTGDAPLAARRDMAAYLIVRLPADAILTVDDAPTKSTGELRRFYTPPLRVGREFTYTLRATWRERGQEVKREKKVVVQAGRETAVDLRQEETPPNGAPSRK
jgi:uncharacterized protein (TIGR03000 family)